MLLDVHHMANMVCTPEIVAKENMIMQQSTITFVNIFTAANIYRAKKKFE